MKTALLGMVCHSRQTLSKEISKTNSYDVYFFPTIYYYSGRYYHIELMSNIGQIPLLFL